MNIDVNIHFSVLRLIKVFTVKIKYWLVLYRTKFLTLFSQFLHRQILQNFVKISTCVNTSTVICAKHNFPKWRPPANGGRAEPARTNQVEERIFAQSLQCSVYWLTDKARQSMSGNVEMDNRETVLHISILMTPIILTWPMFSNKQKSSSETETEKI